MILNTFSNEEIITSLREREKEMKCLYKVQEIINDNLSVDEFLMEIVKHIWGGWQFPMITRVKIIFENRIYKEPGWTETEWVQSADIIIDEKVFGKIEVYYLEFKRLVVDSQFLPEEQKLLNTIAAYISTCIFNRKLLKTLETLEKQKNEVGEPGDNHSELLPVGSDVHWIWRQEMVNKIAAKLDLEEFDIEAVYLIGSVKNATSGPASDIDILIHFGGDEMQKKELMAWFNGWGLCLSEMNLLKTGYATNGLIDLHLVTDDDIRDRTSFASMIGAVTNGAKLIKKRRHD